ncbi:MAG: tetratricopeptide repeat protein [Candidatus Goldiibacteriota bacterium]
MPKNFVFICLLIIFIPVNVFLNTAATKKLFEIQPEWYFLNLNSYKVFSHVLGVAFGYRTLLGDVEYIRFLQYYGDIEHRETGYPELYDYLDRITDADPHFTFAYTYGGAILGFFVNRYDEAVEFIQKGLKYNPKNWKLRFYLGAMLYRQEGRLDRERYVKFLEEALKFDDHPAIIERLLGNIYEQYKPPREAADYWLEIIKTTKDPQTKAHAQKRIIHLIKTGQLRNPDEFMRKLE